MSLDPKYIVIHNPMAGSRITFPKSFITPNIPKAIPKVPSDSVTQKFHVNIKLNTISVTPAAKLSMIVTGFNILIFIANFLLFKFIPRRYTCSIPLLMDWLWESFT